jgi:hypothetical protein
MIRKLFVAAAMLLAASASALAHGNYGYGRVVTVEPHFAISFGTRDHDLFSVLYESGGSRYWTHAPYHRGPVIVQPPHHRLRHVDRHRRFDRGRD